MSWGMACLLGGCLPTGGTGWSARGERDGDDHARTERAAGIRLRFQDEGGG